MRLDDIASDLLLSSVVQPRRARGRYDRAGIARLPATRLASAGRSPRSFGKNAGRSMSAGRLRSDAALPSGRHPRRSAADSSSCPLPPSKVRNSGDIPSALLQIPRPEHIPVANRCRLCRTGIERAFHSFFCKAIIRTAFHRRQKSTAAATWLHSGHRRAAVYIRVAIKARSR